MRKQLLALFVVGFFFAPFSQPTSAQVALEMEPIEADSVITDITLYRNRALVTRSTTLNLDSGGYSVFFRDIPEVAYLDSVQARVSENGSLLSVETSSRPIVVDNSELVAEIVAKIDAVNVEITQASASAEAIQLQINMLKTLIEKATNDKAPSVEMDAFNAQIAFIGKRMQELSVDKTNNAKEIEELQKRLRNLQQRKQLISAHRKKQTNAIIDIGVVRAGTVKVQLTYLVYNASWNPAYAVRANAKGNEITIDYDATLKQQTGENWVDVTLTLSTAQPQQSITPPMPTPWYVDIYQPPPPSAPADNKRGSRSAYGMESGGGFTGMMMDSQIMESRVAEASAAASVVNDGPAVSFVLPRTVTVPSNASDEQTTSIGAIKTSAEHFLIAVPMLTDEVFIRSEVTNESDYILLPGNASIFHGGDYVGKTSLNTITPDETFSLDLGIDPTVTAMRTIVEKTTTSTGLFNSGKQTLYEYQISISNGSDAEIELHVFDRIPISRNEEIEVQLKNESIPLSTDAVYVKTERPQGILRWDLTIPANRTGDQSFALSWQVEVSRGKDIEITPLPE